VFRNWIDTQGLIEYPGKESKHIRKGMTKIQICKKKKKKSHRSGPHVSLGTVLDAKQNFW
jgi:hypothetical protein